MYSEKPKEYVNLKILEMMQKLILISILCVTSTFAALSQNNDQIVKTKRSYYLNDRQLKSKELQTLLESRPESAVVLKKAKTNSTIGYAFIGAGAVCMIYAAVNPPEEAMPGLISDEEMGKWLIPIGIGIGCMITALPFRISGNKLLQKSVTIYNSQQTATGYRNEMKMDIGVTSKGIGIFCEF